MISLERQDQVVILKMSRGATNAINLELVEGLDQAIQEVRAQAEVRALVLASASDKFFSIGFDIPSLFELPRPEFETFYREFNRLCLDLYTLPKPTVAALSGHAIAGGCILALCCDYRRIAEGRKLIGLNEVKLGVPVPYLADCALRHLVDIRYARQILEFGEFYPPERALEMGLVDHVSPLDEVLPGAIQQASMLASYPGEAFALIKRNRVEVVEAQVLSHGVKKQRLFVDCWYSEEARGCLKEAMERF